MRVDRLLGEMGIGQDNAAGRRRFAEAIAARLRRQTVMTLDWIAKRLKMGCRHMEAKCLKKTNKSRDRPLC